MRTRMDRHAEVRWAKSPRSLHARLSVGSKVDSSSVGVGPGSDDYGEAAGGQKVSRDGGSVRSSERNGALPSRAGLQTPANAGRSGKRNSPVSRNQEHQRSGEKTVPANE